MRKLFTLLFVVTGLFAQAQYFINFEGTDTINRKLVVIDTVNYQHNLWQIGKPSKDTFNSAYSLPNVLITDTLHPYASDDTSVFILKVPRWGDTCYIAHIPAPLFGIEFFYKLDIDSNAAASIERSSDNGATWVNLDTIPYGLRWLNPGYDLKKSVHNWTQLELAREWGTTVSDTLLYRFTFISGTNLAGKEGWMIDNIQLWYWCEGAVPLTAQDNTLFSFYPNPSTGTIHVRAGKRPEPGTLLVFDVLGKEIFTKINVLSGDTLDLSLPVGVYTLRYSTGDEYCIKRLIISD